MSAASGSSPPRTPVPLGTTERLFATLHRRFMERGYEPPPWHRLRPEESSAEDVDVARRAWASRAVAEYRSMIVFGELIARFPELGLPLEVTSAASRLLSDEARHTELCARVADALGGHAGVDLDSRDLSLKRDNLPAHLFVARWVTSMFCVGETGSVGILQVLLEHTRDPCIEAVLRILLRDEILHDRFGWALARLVLPRLSDDEQEWLAADLAQTFAFYDQSHGASAEDDVALPYHLGLAPAAARSAAFRRKVDELILPSLAALGVPAYEAWLLRTEIPA
jgi:hypothetical protein